MAKADSPIKIGAVVLKNRITMAPTVKFTAGGDGLVTDFFVNHYAERAKHGVGLICVEATCVAKDARLAPTQLGLWDDGQIEGHRRIAEACHRYGAAVIPQLHHGGVSTHPDCGIPLGPSTVSWFNGFRTTEVTGMTAGQVKDAIRQFTDAAVRAKKAGYDGVQLHGCHSYLINDFASGLNHRTDEYGGSPENRARFGAEIIAGIRAECGPDFLISVRVSGGDPDADEALEIAEYYVKAGCDYLQVSNGIRWMNELGFTHDESLPYNIVAELGVRMHRRFRGRAPVSCVNGLTTPEQVRYLLENDLTDTVDIARGLLADPAFTEAVLEDAPYVKCFSCGKGCGFGPVQEHICPACVKRGVDEYHGIFNAGDLK